MTRDMYKTLISAFLAAGLGQPLLASPAHAGGSVSIAYAPGNAQNAGALATGLRAYSLYRGWRSARIRQSGDRNAAAIGQNGRGNVGIIRQKGSGHSATLQQNGDDNAYGIFQYGKRTAANVEQNGNGGSGVSFSYGW